MSRATKGRSSSQRSRRGKRTVHWQPAVPRPRKAPAGPAAVVNVAGEALTVTSAAELTQAWDQLLPVRDIPAHLMIKHAPQQPWLNRAKERIHCESRREALVAYVLDRDLAVTGMLAQPMWLHRQLTGAWGCPDFLIRGRNGTLTVVEVKSSQVLNGRRGPTEQALAASMAEAAAALGLSYLLADGPSAVAEGYLDLCLVHNSLEPEQLPLIDAVLSAIGSGELSFAALTQQKPRRLVVPVIWHLLWRGDLCLNWEQPQQQEENLILRRHDPCRWSTFGQAFRSCTDPTCGPSIEWMPPG